MTTDTKAPSATWLREFVFDSGFPKDKEDKLYALADRLEVLEEKLVTMGMDERMLMRLGETGKATCPICHSPMVWQRDFGMLQCSSPTCRIPFATVETYVWTMSQYAVAGSKSAAIPARACDPFGAVEDAENRIDKLREEWAGRAWPGRDALMAAVERFRSDLAVELWHSSPASVPAKLSKAFGFALPVGIYQWEYNTACFWLVTAIEKTRPDPNPQDFWDKEGAGEGIATPADLGKLKGRLNPESDLQAHHDAKPARVDAESYGVCPKCDGHRWALGCAGIQACPHCQGTGEQPRKYMADGDSDEPTMPAQALKDWRNTD